MITVHHLEASRSQRILWLLEELHLPYHLQIYQRDPATQLAPAALKKVHPLGKSPVITDGELVIAESGAIIEYLAEVYGAHAPQELAHLTPARGSPEYLPCRFWMHYAEGSLMNWLLMKLVFESLPKQRMPFFVRPIVKALCSQVKKKLITPNVQTALDYMEQHLAQHRWFAGEHLTMADFQMCFAVEAALASPIQAMNRPHVHAYLQRLQSRPAYQRALKRGGPVLISTS